MSVVSYRSARTWRERLDEPPDASERDFLAATILNNPYIPPDHMPHPPQMRFLRLTWEREGFYGGAAGGGKSDALLMAALQYVHIPDYRALMLRLTFQDLAQEGGLMDRAADWIAPVKVRGVRAKWNANKHQWIFPSGARLRFGYLKNDADLRQYQGAAYHFIGIDEVTQWMMRRYLYLFSRQRKLRGLGIPIRMRSGGNPGDIGHEWVKARFIPELDKNTGKLMDKPPFVPARMDDNPSLDREDYEQSLLILAEGDLTLYRQLRDGDWEARPPGKKFRREWFTEITDAFPYGIKLHRFWDTAATVPKPGKEPDWTVGTLGGELNGQFFMGDQVALQGTPLDVETAIRNTAIADGRSVTVHMEQEPGSSGVNMIDNYRRRILKGFSFYGYKTTGSKEMRANPLSALAQSHNVILVRGRSGSQWLSPWFSESEAFPTDGIHDDRVDSASGLYDVSMGSATKSFWSTST